MSSQFQEAFTLRKNIGRDTQGYLETIDREGIGHLQKIIDINGEGSVIRLFFGSTTQMPLRGLTYVLSAARCAQMIPNSQLQIIGTPHLGNFVNGIPIDQSNKQFNKLAKTAKKLLAHTHPDVLDTTVFAIDTPNDSVAAFENIANRAMIAHPDLRTSLESKGAKRGSSASVYVAGHIVFQETGLLKLEPVLDGGPEIAEPTSIVSVGAQSEKPFFRARSLARQLVDQEILLPSVQVFTNHVVPPYFVARGGEQTLDDALNSGIVDTEPKDAAARRDLKHFSQTLQLLGDIDHA